MSQIAEKEKAAQPGQPFQGNNLTFYYGYLLTETFWVYVFEPIVN
jgi:hypothetical protein